MSIKEFIKYNKLQEFYEDEGKTKLKDKEIRVLMSQDLSDYNGSKVFYGFKDINKAFEFYKEEEHLYEILYKDIRKLYFDIDKIEYTKEEFEEWLEKFIESINEELKIETPSILNKELEDVTHFYKNVKSNSVIESIESEIKKSNSDLLVMMPKKYGFWESIVHKSKTRVMASGQNIPLLSIPIE